MANESKVNILLVDDQPAKLLAYEVMLQDLGENLVKANSAREALAMLLKTDVAVVLMDVSMPELDGFELAAMVRDHPRFQRTAIIFVSAVHLSEVDFLRGYQMGAVDYVSVPVVPEVLRAKVRVFADLFRKTRQLEALNASLEARVAERTAALEKAATNLRESERRRTLALAAGQMGSWDWDLTTGDVQWDAGQYRILGVDAESFPITVDSLRSVTHPADWLQLEALVRELSAEAPSCQTEFRVLRPDGELRWCFGTAAVTSTNDGRLVRISGVVMDITDRKRAEEQQALLMREVDHRAKNVLAVVQSLVRLSQADSIESYMAAVEGRIQALSRVHTLIAGTRWQGADLHSLIAAELAPYKVAGANTLLVEGPPFSLDPSTAQALALAFHELSTNAAKYGALSSRGGNVMLNWREQDGKLLLTWAESGGPKAVRPLMSGFGLKVIERTVAGQLDGRVDFNWRPEGVSCTISIPVKKRGKADARRQFHLGQKGVGHSGVPPIMLVEDEALIGIMLSDLLIGMGFAVLGPLTSVSEAREPANSAAIRAALLDVTLHGERVYPVADILTARGVPFAFLTGYGAEAIDPRFVSIPVLQKPIDQAAVASFLSNLPDAVDGEVASAHPSAAAGDNGYEASRDTTKTRPRRQRPSIN